MERNTDSTTQMEDLIKRLVDAEAANTTSLQVQKAQNETLRRDVDRLLKEVEDIKGTTHRIEMMAVSQAAKLLCTAPNLCIDLKTSLERLTATVQALVDYRNETKGGLKVAMALAAVFGSVGGATLTFILRIFILP